MLYVCYVYLFVYLSVSTILTVYTKFFYAAVVTLMTFRSFIFSINK